MKRTPKFQLYRARNGKIVAESGEAYSRKPDIWNLFYLIEDMLRKDVRIEEKLDKPHRKVHK